MTDSSRQRRAFEVCDAALKRDVVERAAFVTVACGDDVALLREVEALLARAQTSEAFLTAPIGAVAAQMLGEAGGAALVGRQVSSYAVVSHLGTGGMGEVYRAHDMKLGRDVAIKILPPAFTSDPERLARFGREARMLAALNHPHIGAIYGLEAVDGIPALVLELVEGPTLADRLAKGPMPFSESLGVARQIAEALDAAHEKGIIHRDLKPANIKITPEGVVKVLDFGLAKTATADGSTPAFPPSPVTVGGTRAGMILGTAAYMSPEQARGLPVDKRTDIWAFGCVLYETLTGRIAFAGATVSDTIAAILEREPDWPALAPTTPPEIVHLLRRCLDKDPKRRLRDIGEAQIQIEASSTNAPETTHRAARRLPLVRRLALVAIVAVVSAALSLATVGFWRSSRDADVSERRLDVVAPGVLDPFSLAVSPDGRYLAFPASTAGGSQLWLRALDQSAAKRLPGTEGAVAPFWAPDSRTLGFFANGKLERIGIGGEPPRVLADTLASGGEIAGGSWSRDDVILFGSNGEMFRIAGTGGEAVNVAPGRKLSSPQFLDDGRRFLVRDGEQVFLGSLDRQGLKPVFKVNSAPRYVSGRVFYEQDGALLVRSFDEDREELVGAPRVVADSVAVNPAGFRFVAFSVSTSGVVAYQAAGQHYRWTWLDREGRVVAAASESTDALPLGQDPALSLDGRRLAVVRTDHGYRDLWIIDTFRGVSTRLTSGAADEADPIWSPDGRQIAFRTDHDLFTRSSSGAGTQEALVKSDFLKWPQDWSRDGRVMLYAEQNPKTGRDLWVLPVTGDRSPRVFANSEFAEWNGQFSPDGRWVAYQSDESGRDEVYARPFTGPGAPWKVSTNGGIMPRWRRDGRELYYVSSDGRLFAAPVRVQGSVLDTGTPVPLFQAGIGPTLLRTSYGVGADGRFLFNLPEDGATSPITVILNWRGFTDR